MELVFILFMLGGGVALAVFVMTAMALARRGEESPSPLAASARDSVTASLLFHVLRSGGTSSEEALRRIRREIGIAAPVTQGIDVASWAETYARDATLTERTALLERAVQLVAAPGDPVPLRQYAALLDLSFGLGFQTDALARLRSVYGFDYVDHARDARLRGTSRDGFVRLPERVDDLFALLGVTGAATRQELGSAYRRLVVQHHPDRFHGATPEVREAAAMKFIEITRAYEKLLLTIRD